MDIIEEHSGAFVVIIRGSTRCVLSSDKELITECIQLDIIVYIGKLGEGKPLAATVIY